MKGLRYDPAAHTWRARRMVAGQRQQRSFGRKDDAVEWLRDRERQAGGLDPVPQRVTLRDGWAMYLAHLTERGTSEETLRHYGPKHAALVRHFGPTAVLETIGRPEISAYIEARRAEGIGNRTLRMELALLRRITDLADLIPQWRMPRFKIVEHPRHVPTPEDLAQLWVRLEGPAQVALGLCLLTGMRASEAMRLEATDVDRRRKTITLSQRKAGDTNVVAVCDTLLALLPTAGPLVDAGVNSVCSALRLAAKRAGIAEISGPGIGRHTFGTWAVAYGGYTSGQVADALGHGAGVTGRYIHAQAVEPLRRPMSAKVESILLAALAAIAHPTVLPFTPQGGRGSP